MSTFSRRLEVFQIHAHLDGQPANYNQLFSAIAALRNTERGIQSSRGHIFLKPFTLVDGVYKFTACEGELGTANLVYDMDTALLEKRRPGPRRFFAQATHGVIDVARREAIIEYNHRGAKADDIAGVLEGLGKAELDTSALGVQLVPRVRASFIQELRHYSRVQFATITVARPNADWSDYNHALNELADDSNGGLVDLSVHASRGESLSTARGIIRYIKEFANHPIATIKRAFIIGQKEGENASSKLKLEEHVLAQTVKIRKDADGLPDEMELERELMAYLRARIHAESRHD